MPEPEIGLKSKKHTQAHTLPQELSPIAPASPCRTSLDCAGLTEVRLPLFRPRCFARRGAQRCQPTGNLRRFQNWGCFTVSKLGPKTEIYKIDEHDKYIYT